MGGVWRVMPLSKKPFPHISMILYVCLIYTYMYFTYHKIYFYNICVHIYIYIYVQYIRMYNMCILPFFEGRCPAQLVSINEIIRIADVLSNMVWKVPTAQHAGVNH